MTQTKNLKKILSHKVVCEKIGKKPSTSLLWPVLGQSSGNEKERVSQRNAGEEGLQSLGKCLVMDEISGIELSLTS